MANSLLTPTMVTREFLRVLHQKLNFVGSITRSYDSSYAREGAKIGADLKIRLPNQFSVRTGKTIDVQDVSESSVTLTVATQKGVDMIFSSSELTLSIDDFSKRYIDPAATVLAANIEADAMSMYKDIYQSVWNGASALTLAKVLAGRKVLQDALCPLDARTASLQTQEGVDLVDALKTLFQDSGQLSTQYREGYMGRVAGFDFVENTLWAAHNRGDAASYVCNTSTGITSGTATITLSGGSGTIKQGDVFTIAGVTKVHPESKVDTGILQQFVASADGTTAIVAYPTPITSGPKQNITIASAGASKTVTVLGTASTAVSTSMLYQEGAFGFATADLEMPQGVDFSARDMVDGISIRVVRDYDINNDNFPCRLDVLYGYKTLRNQLACRLHNN
jgi:hypothetical protein